MCNRRQAGLLRDDAPVDERRDRMLNAPYRRRALADEQG
jgi:hypothetical protein